MTNFRKVAPRSNAFTLVEMLVVIAIVGILAALLLPALSRGKESARSAACLSNLHQVGIALQLYVQENNNILPVMRDIALGTNAPDTNSPPAINVGLAPQLGNTNILHCPSDYEQLYQLTGSSYSWNNLLNGEDADHLVVFGIQFETTQIPVVYDKDSFHKARGPGKEVNYLYADGHIKNLLEMAGGK